MKKKLNHSTPVGIEPETVPATSPYTKTSDIPMN